MIRLSLLSLCLAFGFAACGGGGDDDGGGDNGGGDNCATSELTYDNFGSQFMDDYCQSCHGSTAANRFGAPSSVVFDTLDDVQRQSGRIKARSGTSSSMPPAGNPAPSSAEQADLVEWLDCGAP